MEVVSRILVKASGGAVEIHWRQCRKDEVANSKFEFDQIQNLLKQRQQYQVSFSGRSVFR